MLKLNFEKYIQKAKDGEYLNTSYVEVKRYNSSVRKR